eukprot:TRINITY_DN5139_c0_g1_i1.p1 TRINITY_DN5139_c0_g1~~TRINITY_DN5139_c0_g1_i1.p1  ORF type:complete len:164 (-),score=32.82 TRINITY_DN5139_c0_g1_i1:74-565(-)
MEEPKTETSKNPEEQQSNGTQPKTNLETGTAGKENQTAETEPESPSDGWKKLKLKDKDNRILEIIKDKMNSDLNNGDLTDSSGYRPVRSKSPVQTRETKFVYRDKSPMKERIRIDEKEEPFMTIRPPQSPRNVDSPTKVAFKKSINATRDKSPLRSRGEEGGP